MPFIARGTGCCAKVFPTRNAINNAQQTLMGGKIVGARKTRSSASQRVAARFQRFTEKLIWNSRVQESSVLLIPEFLISKFKTPGPVVWILFFARLSRLC